MSQLADKIFKRKDYYVTSPFGWRKDPFTGVKKYHNGTDYGTHVKEWPQYAIEDGVVLSAGKDSAGGIFAWIKYPRLNKKLLHYHLSKVVVKAGQKVNSDTLVGYTGKTGRATGIHLHLGLMDLSSGKYENADTYVIPEVVVPTPSEEITYKVVKGDTLSGIASKYGTTYQKLAEYNNIANPNIIHIGQVIKIPKSGGSTNPVLKFNDGDKVVINKNARTFTKPRGVFIASFAKERTSVVSEINKDSNDGLIKYNGVAIGRVSLNDLRKI